LDSDAIQNLRMLDPDPYPDLYLQNTKRICAAQISSENPDLDLSPGSGYIKNKFADARFGTVS